MLRKDSKNEHDTSKKDYQQGLKKRQKHTAPHGQKAKKRKLAQKKKATENPDVEKMEVNCPASCTLASMSFVIL